MAVLIPATKEWIEENSNVIMFCYVAEKIEITAEQMKKEMKEKYDIPEEKVVKFINDAINDGFLSQRVGYYRYMPGHGDCYY